MAPVGEIAPGCAKNRIARTAGVGEIPPTLKPNIELMLCCRKEVHVVTVSREPHAFMYVCTVSAALTGMVCCFHFTGVGVANSTPPKRTTYKPTLTFGKEIYHAAACALFFVDRNESGNNLMPYSPVPQMETISFVVLVTP